MFVDENRSAGVGNLGEATHAARTKAYEDPRYVLDQIEISERLPRYGIAGLTLAIGLLGVLAVTSPDGAAGSPVRMGALIAISATTVPVAIIVARIDLRTIWLSETMPMRGANTAFVLYADLGLTAALATFQNPVMALQGTALFAVIGGYVAHFLRIQAMVCHVVFSTAVIVTIGARALLDDTLPGSTALYGIMVSLLAANGTVGLIAIYSAESKRALRLQIESANTDPLTGVLNRRGFRYIAKTAARQTTRPFTIVVVDIDNYKAINDRHGHAVGDDVLERLAAVLVDAVGNTGVVGRLGGDEFAIAGSLDRVSANGLANRIRAAQIGLPCEPRITVSVGAVVYEGKHRPATDGALVDLALKTADRALFEAKNAGRDTYRVVCGDPS